MTAASSELPLVAVRPMSSQLTLKRLWLHLESASIQPSSPQLNTAAAHDSVEQEDATTWCTQVYTLPSAHPPAIGTLSDPQILMNTFRLS